VLTGPDGSFSIAGLAPGTYRVDVETAGFKRSSLQNVQLSTTAPSTVNITLEAGNINETVEIKGTAPNLQTQSGQQALAIYDRTVRELPVIDRNWQELMSLQTGITPPVTLYPFDIDPDHNRFFATNGQNPTINLWLIDGLDNHEAFRGVAIRVQPTESVKEMNIVSGTWTAERGYTGGSNVSVTMRPGTNPWHGSLFEFNSFNGLRSRNTFDTVGNPTPRFTYNQFGGTAGGRLITDKTFFFGSYEGTYNHGQNTILTTVPTSAMVAGNFSGIPGVTVFNPSTGTVLGTGRTAFTNNTIPTASIDTTSAAIAAALPAPTLPGFANNFAANRPYEDDWQKGDVRVDQHFSDTTLLMARYGYSNLHAINASPFGDLLGGSTANRVLGQNAVLDLTHSFSPTLMFDLRGGYNRYETKFRTSPGTLGSALGFANGLPGIAIGGMLPFGPSSNGDLRGVDNNYNGVWNWAWHTSHHNVKFGADIRRFQNDGFFSPLAFGATGTAAFEPGATLSPAVGTLSPNGSFANSFAAFLLGAPTTSGTTSFVTSPSIRQTWYSGYISDTFQYGRRITLDLGVRYDLFEPLSTRKPGGAMYYNPFNNTVNFAGIGGVNLRANVTDVDNVSPHVGFAFSVSNKTVVRGGYSINYYQPPYQFTPYIMPTSTFTSAGVSGTFITVPGAFGPTSPTLTPPSTTTPLVSGSPAPNVPLVGVSRDLQTPYVQNFSVQVQQEFMQSTVLSIGYVGALGRNLPFLQEVNAALPNTGLLGLPYAAAGRTASTLFYSAGLTSNFNSLQTRLSRRFAQGLMFEGAFTYGKVLGYTSGVDNVLQNPFSRRANYGPLDWDRKYTLTLSHLWELPIGAGTHHLNQGVVGQILGNWQINGVFTWDSGTPLNVTANNLFCNCPNLTVVPNVNGSVPTGSLGPGEQFISASSFSTPALGSFGDLGRNAIRGTGFRNYNMSLFRSVPIRDQYKIEFRGEAYNLTNSPHFSSSAINQNFNSALFGQPTSTFNGTTFGRQFNVAIRVLF
jgi:hypothetical protein